MDKLNEMCKFRKDIIDNQILIEQKYGPVVLNQTSNVVLPSSFISETRIVLEITDPTVYETSEADVQDLHDHKEEEEEEEIVFELQTEAMPPRSIEKTDKPITVISPSERKRRSSRPAAVKSSPPTKKKRVQRKVLSEERNDLELHLQEMTDQDEQNTSLSATEDPEIHNEEDEEDVDDKEPGEFKEKYQEIDEAIYNFMNLNCTLCSAKNFMTFTKLRYHYSKEHSSKGFVMCCNVKHLRRHKLYEHVQYHLDPDAFKCPTCGKAFSSSHNLSTHVKMTHLSEDEKLHQCERCELKFGTPFQLKQHMMRHVAAHEKSFECPECSKLFPGKPHLLSHIRFVHEKDRQFSCEHCDRVYTSKISLQNHISSIHEGSANKVQCDHCNKFFANETSIKKHLSRVNDTGELHICAICDHKSPNKAALKGHIDRKHNQKESVCTLCDRAYKSAVTLREHMSTHTGESLYTCLFCPKEFNSNANKYSHLKKNHPREWEAEKKRKSLG